MVHRASESSCPRPYRRSPARVNDGRMSASVTRVAEPPSATSKEASRKRATRSRSKSPARRYSARASVVSKIGSGHARAVVEVEAALLLVRLVVGREEDHRPVEQRELVDRARVVGHEHVADEHQLVDVGVVRDVDGEVREVRADGRLRADERMEPDQQDVVVAEGRLEDAEVEVVGRVGVGDGVAAEGRRVEDDPPAVVEAVALRGPPRASGRSAPPRRGRPSAGCRGRERKRSSGWRNASA